MTATASSPPPRRPLGDLFLLLPTSLLLLLLLLSSLTAAGAAEQGATMALASAPSDSGISSPPPSVPARAASGATAAAKPSSPSSSSSPSFRRGLRYTVAIPLGSEPLCSAQDLADANLCCHPQDGAFCEFFFSVSSSQPSCHLSTLFFYLLTFFAFTLRKKTNKGGCAVCDRGDWIADPDQRCDAGVWADPALCPGILPLDGSGRATVEANTTLTLPAGGGGAGASPLLLNISGAGFDPIPSGNTVELSSGLFTVIAAAPMRLALLFSQPPSLGPLTARVTSFEGSFGGRSEGFVQVATVRTPPSVSLATKQLASSAPSIVIAGSDFDPQAVAANSVAFSPASVVGNVAAATSTSLTVTFSPSSLPLPEGPLSVASVTSFGLSSAENAAAAAAAVQVATVVPAPAVLEDRALKVARNAPTLTISGSGFDASEGGGGNLVSLGLGASATVLSATSTSLVLSFTTPPTSLGPLTAAVTSFGGGSGEAKQVATVVAAPVVAESAAELLVASDSATANSTLVVSGSGFDPWSPAANNVSFSSGATGSVTAATATALTVALSSPPTAAGPLRAVVTSFGGASGAAPGTQVATVVFSPVSTPPPHSPPSSNPLGDAEAARRRKKKKAVAAGAAVAGTSAFFVSVAALALLVHPPLRASVAGYVPFSKKMREQRRARREQQELAARKRRAGRPPAAAAAAAALASSGGRSPASALWSSLLAAPAADGSEGGSIASWGSFGSGSWTNGSGSASGSIGSGSFGLSPLATPTAAATAAGGGTGAGALSRFDSAANNNNNARGSSSGSFTEVVPPLPAPRRTNGNPFSL